MKQLTPMDSHFYYFETPNQPMMIGSLWLCDQRSAPGGLVRHKDILQYVSDRLNTTSYFRRRLEQAPFQLDDPYWLADENFDLEYHVRHVGLPQPGDWRQLCIFTARTMSRSVDMERAPWEIYIIEGVNNVEGMPEGSFAVLIRFHHAYVDGKSSFELSTAMMESTAAHEYGRRDRVEVVERPPTRLEMWARTTPRMLSQSYRSFNASLLFGRKSAELLWRLRDEENLEQLRAPKTIFNAAITPHRSYGGYTWSIPELKRMRQLTAGASLNDVIIAIIAGGMRRYMLMHDCMPEKGSLVSMCPVSIRPEQARHDGGNLVSAMYIPIGTDIEDPVARLAHIRERTLKGIPLAKEVLCDLSNAAGEMIPPYLRALAGWIENKTRIASKIPLFNTVITNVPGLPGMEPKYFAGATISSVFPLVPVSDGMAISHGITGIYSSLSVGVLADRKVVPDMDNYIACIEASTLEYKHLVDELERVAFESSADIESAELAEPIAAEVLAEVVATVTEEIALIDAEAEAEAREKVTGMEQNSDAPADADKVSADDESEKSTREKIAASSARQRPKRDAIEPAAKRKSAGAS
ncbi:wax ester/triacylglycerol synthase family O-acyltransferase [Pseudomonas saliphila]|uniref:wax ester/triacylglycerol synthase family O-acyltransferase n=1 Tax=Pseudomonas saliphila TaxID=2586906 RepID=UPI00123A9317|nr:wax ester/triacylglycerol synthase family O-acyltransferase [Pseudomonas saliphila]